MSDVISTTELPDQAIASCEKITSREGSFLCDSILFQGVKVLISHFGNGPRWGSVTVEQLATWVLLLQKAADEYITLPPELILQVNIEPTPEGILVFVTTDDAEKFSVLHMTDDNSVKKEDIQLALVHQFAYQLAYRITVAVAKELDFDLTNINWNDPQYLWIIEALAVALEDEVFDDRNSYRKRFTPIDRILEKGINQQATEPGQGFAVIKMILTKCKLNDSLKDSLEKIVEGVRAGASKTKILELVEASLVVAQCDFGPQLGVKAKSSVISASLLYQYASLFKGDISLLDDNETKDGSDFVPTTYVFAQGGKEWLKTVQEWVDREDKSDYQLVGVTSIPPLGVYSFFIEPIEGTFPQNLIPYIMIDATNDDGKLLASFASDDDAFVGTSTLGSSKHIILGVTAAQNTLPYNFGGKAPKIFVTLINSDPDKTVQIKGIKFNIKDLTK